MRVSHIVRHIVRCLLECVILNALVRMNVQYDAEIETKGVPIATSFSVASSCGTYCLIQLSHVVCVCRG